MPKELGIEEHNCKWRREYSYKRSYEQFSIRNLKNINGKISRNIKFIKDDSLTTRKAK